MPSVRRALLCVLLSCGALMLPTAALAQSSDQLPSAPSAVLEEKQQQQKPPAPPPPQSKPATPAATSSPSTPVNASQKADPPAQDQKAESLVAPTNPTPDSKATSPDTGSSQIQPAIPENAKAETITVGVNEVNLIFTVTDKHGKFIKNLTENDIHVLDDHKSVDKFRDFKSETDLPLRVGLLIDASNSIRDRFKFEQEAAIEFLNQIVRPKTDMAFVLGFDTTAEVTQDFTNDSEKLSRGVRMLRPGGGTALYDAVYYACRDKLRKATSPSTEVRRAIILVSDGEDNQSRVSRDEAVEMAQRANVIVYSISTNTSGMILHGDKVLEYIAESTGGRAFFPFKIEDVANAFSEIQEELRSQYALAYKPPDFRADGHYRSIEIEAQNNKKLHVRTRKGYYAPAQ
ncbi:MAG TPA: VWA domain-containing protein [Terriglobales bacterium]|nr:VWA domain-containing protein [Terriglobales bacterium]